MRIDDIKPAPVPQLHIDLARPVLVIAGDDQPAAFGRQFACEIKRPLFAHRFDDTIAEAPVSQLPDTFNDAPVIIHLDKLSRAHPVRYFQRKRPPRYGNDPCPAAGGKLRQQRADEADTDDGDRLPCLNPAAFEDVHGAAEGLARKWMTIQLGRQAHHEAGIGNIMDGLDIEFRQLSVYDVAKLEERFDLVIFMGVFYHLRHPLLALDLIHEHVAADMMLFQSLQRGDGRIPDLEEDYPFSEWAMFEDPAYPKLFFVEERYAADPTNWFIPNRAAVEAMLRSAGFIIERHPEREVYLCRRGARHYAAEPPPGE
ncbi:UNVERIFIED_ORG: hypothetical protein QE434_000075 [Rhizobium sp. SORGH_AS 755]|nr:hypothetical protein [Rhizobium sp. SORGH_AS_0755]